MLNASLRDRVLELILQSQRRLRLALDHGAGVRIVVGHSDDVPPILRSLEPLSGVSVLPADGGLLGGTSVAGHFALALGQHGTAQDEVRGAWEYRLLMAWQMCGVGEAEARRLGRALPQTLTQSERWLSGLVLQMLRPLDVLVVDRAFAQLSRREMTHVCGHLEAFRRFHPFRPLLLIDVDVPGLPELPWLRETVMWEEATCLS